MVPNWGEFPEICQSFLIEDAAILYTHILFVTFKLNIINKYHVILYMHNEVFLLEPDI